MTTYNLYKHMGHDGPWLLIKTPKEYRERVRFIETDKPKSERPCRLDLIGKVTTKLPPTLAKACAEWQKADAKRQKADANVGSQNQWWETDAKWQKANAKWREAYAKWLTVINSTEGVALHEQVCGCWWTPEHPDILDGMAGYHD